MLRLEYQKRRTHFLDNAEDLDIAMPIYSLLEYSDNYSMTLGSLWNYYKDEANYSASEINDANSYRINNNKTARSKSFEYKTKLRERVHPIIIVG